MQPEKQNYYGTTILGISKDGKAALGGDGQVTFGNTIMKKKSTKVRRMYDDMVLSGFAGAAADAFTLFEKFEGRLEQYNGNLVRAAVELAKEWRTDRYLRRLEAQLIAIDKKKALVISGTGDIIEPDDGILAIGSGGPYALAASRAMMQYSKLPIDEIVRRALEIASDICIYTNDHITVETL